MASRFTAWSSDESSGGVEVYDNRADAELYAWLNGYTVIEEYILDESGETIDAKSYPYPA